MVDDIKNILISLNLIRKQKLSLDDQESTLKAKLMQYLKNSDMKSFSIT